MTEFRYKIWTCTIKKAVYPNMRVRLDLINVEDGISVAVATLNMSNDKRLKPNQTIIRDYADNEGMLNCLQKNKIVGPTIRQVSVGLRYGHVVEILV